VVNVDTAEERVRAIILKPGGIIVWYSPDGRGAEIEDWTFSEAQKGAMTKTASQEGK
jgi:hypothetical protein